MLGTWPTFCNDEMQEEPKGTKGGRHAESGNGAVVDNGLSTEGRWIADSR